MNDTAEFDAPSEDRPCYRCGKNPAEGFASIWTAATGERWYCHGDDVDDEWPWSCYEEASQTTVIPPGCPVHDSPEDCALFSCPNRVTSPGERTPPEASPFKPKGGPVA